LKAPKGLLLPLQKKHVFALAKEGFTSSGNIAVQLHQAPRACMLVVAIAKEARVCPCKRRLYQFGKHSSTAKGPRACMLFLFLLRKNKKSTCPLKALPVRET